MQSQLLLSDSLIMFASITLNDGAGNILRRRMLSMSSNSVTGERRLLGIQPLDDEARISSALQSIANKPVSEPMPPLQFGIDTPYTVASVYGVENEKYFLATIEAVGRFDGMTTEQVNQVHPLCSLWSSLWSD